MAKKITLFLQDGLPKGLRSVSIGSWNGKVICAPRNSIKKIDKVDVDKSACLYFLISQPDDGDLLKVYVGQSDVFSNRLQNHSYKKDWWEDIVVFYSPDGSLTKTEVQYLEHTLVKILKDDAKSTLLNGNSPAIKKISPEDISVMSIFIENIKLCLPVLGYDIFRTTTDLQNGNLLRLFLKSPKGARANGVLLGDGKLLVKKGSLAIKDNVPSFEKHNYNKLRQTLIETKKLIKKDDFLAFSEDYEFSSSSAAAAIVLGRSARGPKKWKSEDGKWLADIISE